MNFLLLLVFFINNSDLGFLLLFNIFSLMFLPNLYYYFETFEMFFFFLYIDDEVHRVCKTAGDPCGCTRQYYQRSGFPLPFPWIKCWSVFSS